MVDPISIGGLVVSTLQLGSQWLKDYKDANKWREEDLPIDSQFVNAAIDAKLLEGPSENYSFMKVEKIPTAELKKTHAVVFAVNEGKKIKYRLVQGIKSTTPVALVKKL